MDWYNYFNKMCDVVASKSKDPHRKVGCVIVGPNHEIRSTGYNGAPRNVEERFERPVKYLYVVCAERNAIYNAARNGIRLEDCSIYITRPPCNECVKAIIQAGIKEVYARPLPDDAQKRWENINIVAKDMLKEANVNYYERRLNEDNRKGL